MKKFLVLILSLILISIASFVVFYNINIKAVSKKSVEVEFMVDTGSTYYTIASKLKSSDLIKNEFCYKLYVKFNKTSKLEAGTYKLNKNMSVSEIINVLSKGNNYNPDAIVITFKEGINARKFAKVVSENTNNLYTDVLDTFSNKEYLNEVIEKYWFIDDSILNSNIYYPLEGYLYPNTYEFQNKDVTTQDIMNKMLDEMDKKLSKYKDDIENSKYSAHEILTLASIIELEGGKSSDRKGIAGVFYNRLKNGWSLGSDVTTYYAAKIELNERDLYQYEINDNNAYNTRSTYLAGKLPIGPICNPSIDSIVAALNPTESDYFYFVADKNGNTYFSKTYQEHLSTKNDLIEAGLWYTYE